jgi:transposase
MLFDLSGLRRLGIDEISLRKGQEDYIVVLVDLDKKELIGMVSSRKHKDIKAELKSWGEEVLGQIKEVSIDMSGSYRGLIKKVLPNADIVADRFHVMKLVNDELNRARNTEKRAISKLKDTPKKKKVESIFKNSKYALLKPEENLTEKQKIKLEEIKKAFPGLAKMHQQKESFRIIFKMAKIGQMAYSSCWVGSKKHRRHFETVLVQLFAGLGRFVTILNIEQRVEQLKG